MEIIKKKIKEIKENKNFSDNEKTDLIGLFIFGNKYKKGE